MNGWLELLNHKEIRSFLKFLKSLSNNERIVLAWSMATYKSSGDIAPLIRATDITSHEVSVDCAGPPVTIYDSETVQAIEEEVERRWAKICLEEKLGIYPVNQPYLLKNKTEPHEILFGIGHLFSDALFNDGGEFDVKMPNYTLFARQETVARAIQNVEVAETLAKEWMSKHPHESTFEELLAHLRPYERSIVKAQHGDYMHLER